MDGAVPWGRTRTFKLGATCVEVKTSTAATLDRLAISGERQLEVPDDVVLILLGLSLDRRVGHGETLPGMIESVRNAASESGCLHLVDLRLDLCGYERDDAESVLGYRIHCPLTAPLPSGGGIPQNRVRQSTARNQRRGLYGFHGLVWRLSAHGGKAAKTP